MLELWHELAADDVSLVISVQPVEDNPGGDDGQYEDSEVETDGDEVVGVALRLHAT